MRAFVLSILISWLALGFTPSYQTPADKWSKKSCVSDLFCCHRGQSQPNALKNLMPRPKGGTKCTYLLLSPNLPSSLSSTQFEVDGAEEVVIKYEQSSILRVGLDNDEKRGTQINILTQTDDDDEEGIWSFSPCDNQLAYRLPFEEDGHTFMSWDWGAANLFFTSDLTGCDMFVAKSESDQTKALIIHSNLNKYGALKDQAKNLRIKGEIAEKIVNSFAGYRLVMRLYSRPTCPAAKRFIEKYQSDHSSPGSKIFLYEYDADKFQDGTIFFGRDGKFYVKPKIGGETRELKATLE